MPGDNGRRVFNEVSGTQARATAANTIFQMTAPHREEESPWDVVIRTCKEALREGRPFMLNTLSKIIWPPDMSILDDTRKEKLSHLRLLACLWERNLDVSLHVRDIHGSIHLHIKLPSINLEEEQAIQWLENNSKGHCSKPSAFRKMPLRCVYRDIESFEVLPIEGKKMWEEYECDVLNGQIVSFPPDKNNKHRYRIEVYSFFGFRGGIEILGEC